MAKSRRKKPRHPLLDKHALKALLRAGDPLDPEDVSDMPWPARLATFVLAFDGQMGQNGSQFWITNEWRVHDPALLEVLSELRFPLAREVSKLVKKTAKIGVRSDILDAHAGSAKVDAAYERLAERCGAVDEAYYGMRAAFLAEVETVLAGWLRDHGGHDATVR